MILFCQPLFPGESGVDQLVEIIKVKKKNAFFMFVILGHLFESPMVTH